MRAPDGLGAAGKHAWARALRAVAGAEDEDQLYDLAARYAHAVDLSATARREWRALGGPLLEPYPNGATGVHPLIKVMQDADKQAQRFGADLGIKVSGKQRRRGPDPKAVVQSDIGQSPAQRLRAVPN